MPSLMFVGAHPDDDTFAVARSMALYARHPDVRLVVVYATDGEAGEIAPDSGVRREELGMVRRQEAVASWRAVGRQPDRYEWLGFPDSRLADEPVELLVDRIAAVLDEERPDVVATFGPDGITGHPDHIAVGTATTAAFHRLAGDGKSGLRRLLYGAIPQSWIDLWNRQRREAGMWEWDPSEPFHLRGVPDEMIGIDVDTEAVVERVRSAVRSHRTQWSYQTMDNDRALSESLRREHWVVAWPPPPPGGPPLRDIFENL